jgi:hypothetical protein
MENSKAVLRQILLRVVIVMFLTCALLAAGAYWLLQLASTQTRMLAEQHPQSAQIGQAAQWVDIALNAFWPYVVPAAILFFLLLSFILWAVLRGPVTRRIQAADRKPAARPRPADEARQQMDANKRIFVHLLSVLQREGRLVDFLAENLAQYPDAQIGAAVRTIHENCQKTLDKYLKPQSVLEQQEGEPITVEPDFDPNALKLIGNVTGKPPFKGTVRHRGWRAGKIELPTLSGRQDPAIIAPAEVEVN